MLQAHTARSALTKLNRLSAGKQPACLAIAKRSQTCLKLLGCYRISYSQAGGEVGGDGSDQ
eukprot:1198578-Amphidinium_carterae.1